MPREARPIPDREARYPREREGEHDALDRPWASDLGSRPSIDDRRRVDQGLNLSEMNRPRTDPGQSDRRPGSVLTGNDTPAQFNPNAKVDPSALRPTPGQLPKPRRAGGHEKGVR